MSLFLYNCYVGFLGFAIRLASPFSRKAKRWKADRKSQQITLPAEEKKIWFHVSSLGELEQAYPLIQEIKKHKYTSVVSFFSHSGYDYRDRYPSIDVSLLLPLDSRPNALKVVRDIDADLVFWTKNDFWLNTQNVIIQTGTPLILFAATFYDGHFIGKPGFSIFRKSFSNFEHIFVQDSDSLHNLEKCGISNTSIVGDTRVNRVKLRAQSSKSIKGIKSFIDNMPVLVMASVHEEDNSLIQKAIFAFKGKYKIIVVPHELDMPIIGKIMDGVSKDLYQINDRFEDVASDILVFRKMGVLFDIYKEADIVYIGGGFGSGIHNILEPTVFGKSVIFGPRYQKFWEAKTFLKLNLSKSCKDADEFIQILNSLNLMERERIENGLESFYKNYPDSVEKIMTYCLTKKLIN